MFRKKHTWEETFIEMIQENNRGNKVTTLRNYYYSFYRRILKNLNLVCKYIEDFNFAEFKKWKITTLSCRKKDNTEYSIDSLHKDYTILVRLCDHALTSGWVDQNIAKLSDCFHADKNKPVTKKKLKFQTLDEYYEFMKVVDDDLLFGCFQFVFWNCPRTSELLSLRWSDYNFLTHKMKMNETVTWATFEKGYKIISNKNSTYAERVIDEDSQKFLYKLFLERSQKKDFEISDFIFSVKNTKHPSSRNWIDGKMKFYYQVLQEKYPNAKINTLTPHQFGRHSQATILSQSGASITLVAYLLRDSEATVKKVYFHDYEDQLNEDLMSYRAQLRRNTF